MRSVALCLLVMASSAGAQVLSSPGRLWLTGGAAYRDHRQLAPDGTLLLQVGGTGAAIAPTTLHLSGAWFFNDFLGANLEARSELFFATQGTTRIAQPGAELTLSAAARWLPVSWLSLEGQLGWSVQGRSIILAGPLQGNATFMAPNVGLAVGLSPSHVFVSQLFFRVQPVVIPFGPNTGFTGYALAGGAQVSLGALRIGDVQLAAAVTLEATSTRLVTSLAVGQQTGVRLGLGVSVMRAPVEVAVSALVRDEVKEKVEPVKVKVEPTGPGRIRGVVKSEEKPVAGAAISSGEQKTVANGEGGFVLENVGPGPVKVQVKAAGFNDAEEVAQVPAEAEATLDFVLVPKAVEVRATLRGLIRAKSGETLKATVRVVERKLKLQVKADGRFSAEVPSGKYTLIIEARGYVTQTKIVEVSGGDQAIFHAELERTR